MTMFRLEVMAARKYEQFLGWLFEGLTSFKSWCWGALDSVKHIIVACLKSPPFWVCVAAYVHFNAWSIALFMFQVAMGGGVIYGGWHLVKAIGDDEDQEDQNARTGLQYLFNSFTSTLFVQSFSDCFAKYVSIF